jgi:membrane protein
MIWKTAIRKIFHFLWVVLRKFDEDHGFFLSSGIAFSLLISLIPLSLLLLALVGTYLYSDHEVLDHLHYFLGEVIPSLDPSLRRNILEVVQSRKIAGLLGIGGLIWTATWVFSSLRTSLNTVFQIEKGRGILKGKAVDLFMIFMAGLFHVVSISLTSLAIYIDRTSSGSPLEMGWMTRFFMKYPMPYVFSFWMFFLIYEVIPNRKIHFRTAFWAALFTSLFWEVAKLFFGWYVLNLGRFTLVYGYMGTLVVFVLWVYYSSAILLLGGEVAFLLEKERGRINA